MKLEHMRTAIRLASEHMLSGDGGPFGAVVIRQGEVLSEGWNQVTSTHDPTAHAEVIAIRRACAKLQTFDLSGCELYCSCEPCPMCLAAVYWARLDRLYFGATRQQAAAAGFSDQAIYEEVKKLIHERSIPTQQVLGDEAQVPFDEWLAKGDRVEY